MLPNRSAFSKHIEFNRIEIIQGPISSSNSPCNFFGFAGLIGCEVAFQQCPGSCLKTNDSISSACHQSKTALAPTMVAINSRELALLGTDSPPNHVRGS